MTKKKKLVDNFQEIIDSGDFEAFRSVFEKCEITATGKGKTTCNAFSYQNLTPEHIQFLIDNGLKVNGDCGFGYPPVAFHAANKENLKCLLQNGADIDYIAVFYRGSALTKACSTLNAEAVKNLLDELSAALDELYELFDVAPVARRTMHNGTTQISVKGKRWQDQYDELWNMLVPGMGKAKTIQGERLYTLSGFLDYNKGMETELIKEATGIIKHITVSTDKNTLYRLTEIIVKWVLDNPEPISLSEVNYER